jgi:L-2,4-diaminobutyrate decarboxylase
MGIPDLVSRSLLTTRRFDALKVWVTLQVLGRDKLAAMIERTLELAAGAAELIEAEPRLELLHRPELGCMVFRYQPSDALANADAINDGLRRRLYDEGRAVIGHTRVRGRSCLKLTFLNPCTTRDQVATLLRLVVARGREVEADVAPRRVAVGAA